MNRKLAGLVLAAAGLSLAACSRLPENVKKRVDDEQRQFASARSEFQKDRDQVTRDLKQESELLKSRALEWPSSLDRAASRMSQAEADLKRAADLRGQDREKSRPEIERLLNEEQQLRADAMNEARRIRDEDQRWLTIRKDPEGAVRQTDQLAQQLAAADLAAVTTVVHQAATDWPDKKSDLENRLSSIRTSDEAAVKDWQLFKSSWNAKSPDYGSLFSISEEVRTEAASLPPQVDSLRTLSGQLYNSWDKILVDLSDDHNDYEEKLRTINTHYTDVANKKTDVSSQESWVPIGKGVYQALENDIGMTVEHKAAGKYDTEADKTPQPPGFAYMAPPSAGRNEYGFWNGGVWTWLPQYLIMRDLLYHNSYYPVPMRDYDGYWSARRSGQTYYGRDADNTPKYGSHGTFTSRSYSGSRYVQSHGSGSYSASRPSSGSGGRTFGSGSSSDSAGRRFGTGRSGGSSSPGRTFGSGRSAGRSFGGRRR